MAIARWDGTVQDAQGRSLSGAQIFFCTQPATTNVIPPSPLATIYSDFALDPVTQPLITDGYGHADAYMDDSVLYTIVYVHPLFFSPLIFPDQSIAGGGGGGGSSLIPFAGTPSGTKDGSNKVFTLTNNGTALPATAIASTVEVWLNFTLVPGAGYLLSGNTITYANAPQPQDVIFAQGFYA